MKTKNNYTPSGRDLRTSNFSKTIFVFILLLVMKTAAYSQTGQTFFEIDGNYQQSVSGKIDWNSVVPSTPGTNFIGDNEGAFWGVDQNWGVQSPSRGDTSQFGCCANKNGDDIGPGTNNWTWNGIGQEPQKNDITNIFLYWKVISGKVYLFGAAETRATNGDSHLDFEYNQAGIYATGTGSGFIKGNGPSKGRTQGDFLISVDYVNGGSNPLVTLREWRNGNWSQASPLNNQNNLNVRADARWNTQTIPAIFPGRGFNTNGAVSNDVVALQHFEFCVTSPVIDATWPTIGTNASICDRRATFRFATRSSQSFTAELKDLALVNLNYGTPPVAGINCPAAQCQQSGGNTFALSPSSPVCNSGNFTYKWSVVSQTAGITSAVIANVNSCSTTINIVSSTPNADQKVVVKLKVNEGVCSDSTTCEITIKGNPVCTITGGSSPLCPYASSFEVCTPDQGATVSWTLANSGGSNAKFSNDLLTATGRCATINPGTKCGSFTVTATVSKNGCSSTCNKVFVVQDNTPPVITSCPASRTISCTETVRFGTITYTDNCTPNAPLKVDSADTAPEIINGSTVYMRSWTVTDACGNTSLPCTQIITQLPCSTYCSYTQGAFGTIGGMHCNGQTTRDFVRSLLATSMTVGVDGAKKIVFTNLDADCIISKLPGGGQAAALGNSYTCATIVPLNNGKIYNNLLSQTITLSLNLRIPGNNLSNLRLSGRYITTAPSSSTNCSSTGVATGVGSTFTLPQSVLTYLGSNNKVSDLLALANNALAGLYTGTNPSLTDIQNAVDVINNAFDGCRALVSISNTLSTARMAAPSENTIQNITAYPNPFSSKLNITFTLTEASPVTVKVYSIDGSYSTVIFNAEVEPNHEYIAEFDGSKLSSGIYIYKITTANKEYTGRVSLVKN